MDEENRECIEMQSLLTKENAELSDYFLLRKAPFLGNVFAIIGLIVGLIVFYLKIAGHIHESSREFVVYFLIYPTAVFLACVFVVIALKTLYDSISVASLGDLCSIKFINKNDKLLHVVIKLVYVPLVLLAALPGAYVLAVNVLFMFSGQIFELFSW